MKITSIWTVRQLQGQVFRQIVEEWEDDFAVELGLPLQDMSVYELRSNSRFGGVISRLSSVYSPWDSGGRWRSRPVAEFGLEFLLWPPRYSANYCIQPDVVPIVLDFWAEHMPSAEKVFARSPHLFVTNTEIVQKLASTSLGSKASYLPLSVSIRHVKPVTIPRTIDLIQVGRKNRWLHEWALEYVRLHPGATYMYSDTSGMWPCWTATDRGRLEIDTSRASYWQLLRSSRISLVSAPGIDGGEVRTGGYNPVTPRFYESAAARCHLIGRFPQAGADFVANRVASVCRHVDSLDEFVVAVDAARKAAPEEAKLDDFLAGHTTAEVARTFRSILNRPGSAITV